MSSNKLTLHLKNFIIGICGVVLLALPFLANAYSSPYLPYANVETVYEGELCGDVDELARRGGTYYMCADGLSCDFFEPGTAYNHEPYGICVPDQVHMCLQTGGDVYQDRTCNCPLASNGGCDDDVIEVTHRSVYDAVRDELDVYVTAKNTSARTVEWSEFHEGCSSTVRDVYGVRLQLADPPIRFSPYPNPLPTYIIGDEDTFREYDGVGLQYLSDGSGCQNEVKNTFSFGPRESKTHVITISGHELDDVSYLVEAKYGGEFEFTSSPELAHLIPCEDGQIIQDGVCRNIRQVQCSNTGGVLVDNQCMPIGEVKATDSVDVTRTHYETQVAREMFTDMRFHWGKRYIEQLVQLGVMEGYSDRTFRPDQNITRAEFLAAVLRGMSYDVPGDVANVPVFNDVARYDWFAPYVNYAALNGIAHGYEQGGFGPEASITRAEAMAIVMRARGINAFDYRDSYFSDITEMWHIQYIESAYRLGLIHGRGDGKFYPNDHLTRAEAAKIIANVIDLQPTNAPFHRDYTNHSNIIWQK